MKTQIKLQELEIKFIAKVGTAGKYSDGEEKFHVMIPKRFMDKVRRLKGEQVKVIINDSY